MPGVTMKVSSQTRDRIKTLAEQSGKSMASVIDEAMACYEARLQQCAYVEAWTRFQHDDPQGFADYMQESSRIEQGLDDVVPD